ncbi:4-hydroxy-tetrahydrodipicolinate synthase [Rhizomonospora bruguierae]|uniref:4-hydroxy-tetrahydrodipicolinate synthase n=1 Tax=Rhizomonospora bruguierae TaxID=1581705 RepID=UPI001BCBB178|nr:4-hydroxy-tetrahydrodipicolinate synthase [Micromonospora sp. NBRC 107566]
MTRDVRRPFGRLLTAMVTPFRRDGALDVEGAAELAAWLVDEQGNDGLVVSGTTGESPTTTDLEKDRLLRAVIEAVGGRATVIAGVGSYDTHHTVECARAAEKAGAHGLLVVTPYYNKPPQAGLVKHFTAIAEATGLPVMLYDIPGRTGTPIATETLLTLAEHERIVAVKDAKYDLLGTTRVLAGSDLAVYSGADEVNLALAAIGSCGAVSVVAHVVGPRINEMYDALERGDAAGAARLNQRLAPVYTGLMTRTQGVISTKAALAMLGRPSGPVRPPLIDADDDLRGLLAEDLAAAGVHLGATA